MKHSESFNEQTGIYGDFMTTQSQVPCSVLLVEDDSSLAAWIKDYLATKGFVVTICARGDLALDMIRQTHPDMVILDGMLPGLDGFEVCKAARPDYTAPILMLTARDEDVDEILGLELGADDYITKPVKPRVLLAHMKALLRRPALKSQQDNGLNQLDFGDLLIEREARRVELNGVKLDISSNEFDVLWILASQAGNVVTREELVTQLRGFDYDGMDRSIDLRVSRLRKKLGDDPSSPKRIKTIWGKGYLFAR